MVGYSKLRDILRFLRFFDTSSGLCITESLTHYVCGDKQVTRLMYIFENKFKMLGKIVYWEA